jgi:diguanylate cyclase (GGDEF)-like protein
LTEAGQPATEQTRRDLPLQALPVLHKASGLLALPPGGELEGRLPDETAALRRVATWAKEFLSRPHPDLGRSGHVCPWVNASIRNERFLLTLTRRAHENLSAAEQTFLRLKRYFLEEMQPTTGREAQLKTIVVLFTGLPPDEVPSIINGLHVRLKPQFVREGLMLGEFFSKCEKEGLRNPKFRPLRSETPLIVIRSMVETDIAFLADDSTFVRAYLRKFQANGVDEVFSLLKQRPHTPRDRVALLLNTVAEFDVSDGRPVEKDRSTGLFKSPQLLKRLESELQRAAPMTSQTVMVLGVDALESSLSSDKANEASHLLWDVARMVKSGQRAESLLVRHGSDSLALLALHIKPELAGILAERIRAACETRPTTPEASLATTLSIGIATVTKGRTHAIASDVLTAADRACAAARAEGGNRIVMADLPTG